MDKIIELKRKIEPQPITPVVSFYHSTDDDYEDYYGWCYQSPEADTETGLVYNAPHEFKDHNQPGKKGDRYEGGIIESVRIVIEAGTAYWVIRLKVEQDRT